MTNFVDYSNATALVTRIGQKLSALNGAYVFKGSSTLANLPSLATATAAMVGYVYNMSEDFTTTADFVEGAGKKYSAGTNVAIANVGTTQVPSYKFDVISAFVNVDAINGRIDDVREMISADAFAASNAYAIGDIITYGDGLYKFKTAHTADDPWSSTEVDEVDVITLIEAAEPDSLTTEQVNTLLALLD